MLFFFLFIWQDSLDLSTIPCAEETHSFSWYDEQLQMASTIAQHGFCLYAKHIAAVGSTSVSDYEVDLASEMLASTTNTMALGKLSRPEVRAGWTSRKGVRMELPERDPFLRRYMSELIVTSQVYASHMLTNSFML